MKELNRTSRTNTTSFIQAISGRKVKLFFDFIYKMSSTLS